MNLDLSEVLKCLAVQLDQEPAKCLREYGAAGCRLPW